MMSGNVTTTTNHRHGQLKQRLAHAARRRGIATYTYDALGVRKSKTVNGQTTRYLTATIGGLPHVLAETDASGAAKRVYMYAGNQQIKQEGVPGDRSADAYLLHDNNVGSLTHAIGMQGNITAQFDYDAFGVPTVKQGSVNSYGYTGEEYDGEAGLLYLRARYYDPRIGRFISADSYLGRLAEPGTQNRYVYVQNNPLLMTDPTGNAVSVGVCATAGAGVVASGCPFVVNFAGGEASLTTQVGGGHVSGPTASLMLNISWTSATSVDQIPGLGFQEGVSFPVVIDVGFGSVQSPGGNGGYFEFGLGVGVPVTAQGQVTHSTEWGSTVTGDTTPHQQLLPPVSGMKSIEYEISKGQYCGANTQ
ncbi:MAG: RHS repeat-associated core domain-containing protein [Pseudomonadota bacterium]